MALLLAFFAGCFVGMGIMFVVARKAMHLGVGKAFEELEHEYPEAFDRMRKAVRGA